jgi:protoheme IX farnesyltransferase
MKTTAISLPRLTLPSLSGLTARQGDFVTLMKPRVMLLAVFTALVGFMIAPGHLDPLLGSIAILAIAAGAGAAGVLNMWYDADIDAVMTRTAMRPIPRGKISRVEALVFGVALASGAVAVLGFALNVLAAALLAFAISFYFVVYTVWLKRRTPQNIVIGGAAGALPPAIGWAAATGSIGLESLILFLIVFMWTPPHFWALSLNRSDEYARAGIPMLPVVAGRTATARQILIYSMLLVPTSFLPWVLGFAGQIYGATAVICGTILIALTLQLVRSGATDRRAAPRVFAFSIVYLFVLFAALLAGGSINRETHMLSGRGAWDNRGLVQTKLSPHLARAACSSSLVKADEV